LCNIYAFIYIAMYSVDTRLIVKLLVFLVLLIKRNPKSIMNLENTFSAFFIVFFIILLKFYIMI